MEGPPRVTIPLGAIAHGRSGDKGNHANVAIIAYTQVGFAWLRDHLTADVVRDYFVLYDVLAGGASESLRIDTQGKTLALALLQMSLPRPDNYAAMLRPAKGEP